MQAGTPDKIWQWLRFAADTKGEKILPCDAGPSLTILSQKVLKQRIKNASAMRSNLLDLVAAFLSQIWFG